MSRTEKTTTTMADIATMAGVHVSTVSRALGDSPLVEKSMRERINRIAKEQGYVANSVARSLRAGRSQTLCVAIPLAHERSQVLSDPFFASMIGHLADAITERGYGMYLQKILPPMQGWMQRLVAERRADGIIVVGQSTEHQTLQQAARTSIPFVVWGGLYDKQDYCSVGTDNVAAARHATEHLLSMGRRKILFLGDPAIPEIQLRCEGYRQALAAGPAGTGKPLIVKAHLTVEAATTAIQQHIAKGLGFDAIFAATDIIAISAMRVLASAGITVPTDVSVVGFDDIHLGAHVHPALTTVRQDVTTGARLLVDLLLQRISGETIEPFMMPGELVVRESCGGTVDTTQQQV